MGKLTEAYKKLDSSHRAFAAGVDNWQEETRNYFAQVKRYSEEIGKLTKVDNEIVHAIQDQEERSDKAWELANIRENKLKSIWPSATNASDAQKKAFASCDEFGKVVAQFDALLQQYDTKGKTTKEQKKQAAHKLLAKAKVDLATVKHAKIGTLYQAEDGLFTDVKEAREEMEKASKELQILQQIEVVQKRFANMLKELKTEVAVIDA